MQVGVENMSKDYTKEITAEDLKSLNNALVEKLDAQIKEQSRMLEVLRFRTRTPR